ncbi:MAG: YsnF/AvaK domain-containing protein [bacterium]|nr:YsnF/AvaK domain-containing protein [bacterium]
MKTLIAIYETEDIARRVETDLIGAGIEQSAIRVEGGVYEDDSRQGGIGGFFNWLFGNDSTRGDADVYAESLRRGDYAVIVETDDAQIDAIEDVLYSYSPVDVDSRGEYFRQSGWSAYDTQSRVMTSDEVAADRAEYTRSYSEGGMYNRDDIDSITSGQRVDQGEQARFEVVEEDMNVSKRTVDRGGVRVRSYVTERPVRADVNLREEHVTIDRHPVDRPASDADFSTFGEGEIEVREMGEEAVISKTARVVEEVVVGKEATERTETVQGTVRRKDVEIDPMADTQPNRNNTLSDSDDLNDLNR